MERGGERRLVITIQPQPSDDGLLKVNDALQQVLDYLKVVEAAGKAMSSDPQNAIEWKLESASTNSPLTVVVVAEPRNPTVDITPIAVSAKREAARAFRQIREHKTVPPWLGQEARAAIRNLMQRNLSSIASTTARSEAPDDAVEITRQTAATDFQAIQQLSPLEGLSIPARRTTGEITGHLLGVGRYRRAPALTILTALYGRVACSIPADLVEELGGERTLEDVWKGRSVAVYGTLYYAVAGHLQRIVAQSIRDREAPPVDLDAIYDTGFTDGMEPTEYLDRLHEGRLA